MDKAKLSSLEDLITQAKEYIVNGIVANGHDPKLAEAVAETYITVSLEVLRLMEGDNQPINRLPI